MGVLASAHDESRARPPPAQAAAVGCPARVDRAAQRRRTSWSLRSSRPERVLTQTPRSQAPPLSPRRRATVLAHRAASPRPACHMSSEALLLALSTAIRPTTVAALFAILAHSHPHRLLVAYIVGGLAFSLTDRRDDRGSSSRRRAGVVVNGVPTGPGHRAGRSGSGLRQCGMGRMAARRSSASSPAEAPGWMHRHLRDLSVRSAAAAGVFTHLPGVIYLAALNSITGSTRESSMGFSR